MAIFHSTAKVISRSSGRSSVGAAAYRAGEKLKNEYDGVTHNYNKKTGVVHSEIILTPTAPVEFQNREILWNAVEKSEKRKDAQTAREIEIALPKELNREQQINFVRDYVRKNFVDVGMCADVAIHDKHKNNENTHAHIMLTTREVNQDGFGLKKREWNNRNNIELWRKNLAQSINNVLEEKGLVERVDHRSFKEQCLEKIPTIHLGSAASQMERRGEITERGDYNREVKKINKELEAIENEIQKLTYVIDFNVAEHKKVQAEIKTALEYKVDQNKKQIEKVPAPKKTISENELITLPFAARQDYIKVTISLKQQQEFLANCRPSEQDILKIKELEKIKNVIDTSRKEISTFKEKRGNLGILKIKEKSNIDQELLALTNVIDGNLEKLKNIKVEYKDIPSEINRLVENINSLNIQKKKIQSNIENLKNTQAKIIDKYSQYTNYISKLPLETQERILINAERHINEKAKSNQNQFSIKEFQAENEARKALPLTVVKNKERQKEISKIHRSSHGLDR